jgi:hypothetical protein
MEHPNRDLAQFWNNTVHSPTGRATGALCNGGNNTLAGPMADTDATGMAHILLAPYPRAA